MFNTMPMLPSAITNTYADWPVFVPPKPLVQSCLRLEKTIMGWVGKVMLRCGSFISLCARENAEIITHKLCAKLGVDSMPPLRAGRRGFRLAVLGTWLFDMMIAWEEPPPHPLPPNIFIADLHESQDPTFGGQKVGFPRIIGNFSCLLGQRS